MKGSRSSLAAAGFAALVGATAMQLGCHSKDVAPADAGPPPEGVANTKELMTKIGSGRVPQQKNKEIHLPGTSINWTSVFPIDAQHAVLGGVGPTEAAILRTDDAGATWTTIRQDIDTPYVTFSAGLDNNAVLLLAKHAPPPAKKTPSTDPKAPKDPPPPIDQLSAYFETDDKLSALTKLLPLADKPNAVIPKGNGQVAVLALPSSGSGPSVAVSYIVELGAKSWQIMYAVPPPAAAPASIAIPANETPVFASFGRPPVLLTMSAKELLARPWPLPGEALAAPTPIAKVALTKTLQDELSVGPECEYRGWSFLRFKQPGEKQPGQKDAPIDKIMVLAISKEKQVAFDLPGTTNLGQRMACDDKKVAVEAADPTSNMAPALVICPITGDCTLPQNHAFSAPWPEQHERTLAMAPTAQGIVAVQTMVNQLRWSFLQSATVNGGVAYDHEREVLDGRGETGRLLIGALIGFGDRTVLLTTAQVTGTSARGWYEMVTVDGGENWVAP